MEEFLSNIKLLTGTLGHKFLEIPVLSNDVSDIKVSESKSTGSENLIDAKSNLEVYLNIKGIEAKAIQTNEGLVVLKGSEVAVHATKNYGYATLRDKLILNGVILKTSNEKMIFAKNHLFTSASGAASVIVGYSANGRSTWKNEDGKSIKEIEKSEVK